MRFKRRLRKHKLAFAALINILVIGSITVSVSGSIWAFTYGPMGSRCLTFEERCALLDDDLGWWDTNSGGTNSLNNNCVPVTPSQLAPVFGVPTPQDGAENQPRTFTWSILITQSNDYPFNWWINCSNGNSSEGINDVGGIKTLSISGLEYSTTYIVVVTAKTVGILNKTNTAAYTFSTSSNWPIEFGDPNPEDGAVDQPICYMSWMISMTDPEDNDFDYWINCSNGKTSSGTKWGDGCVILFLGDLELDTTYYVTVEAIDSITGIKTTGAYSFTTQETNKPVDIIFIFPEDGATNQPLEVLWGASMRDPERDNFDWLVSCNNGQELSGTYTGQDTCTGWLSLSGLDYSTTYTVTVSATDSGSGIETTAQYTFTTESDPDPDPPEGPGLGPGPAPIPLG